MVEARFPPQRHKGRVITGPGPSDAPWHTKGAAGNWLVLELPLTHTHTIHSHTVPAHILQPPKNRDPSLTTITLTTDTDFFTAVFRIMRERHWLYCIHIHILHTHKKASFRPLLAGKCSESSRVYRCRLWVGKGIRHRGPKAWDISRHYY